MATSDNEKTRELQTLDSDELRGMYCEHCNILISKNVPAEGFCVDCLEYMCSTCLRYHKMYMPTHSIQDHDTMPQEFCLENCDDHPKKLIKYYCSVCQGFACTECKTVDHNTCNDVQYLPNLVNGIEKSVEYTELNETLEKLIFELNDIKEEAERYLIYVDVQNNKARSTINKHTENILGDFRKRVCKTLDDFDRKVEETVAKMEKERGILVEQQAEEERKLTEEIDRATKNVTKAIDHIRSEDTQALLEVKSQIKTLSPDLNDQSDSLKQEQRVGNRCKLFMLMKQAGKGVDKVQEHVKELKRTNISYYVITPEVINLSDRCQDSKNKYFTLRMLPPCKEARHASLCRDVTIENVKMIPVSCLLLHETFLLTCEGFPFLYIFKDVNNDKIICEKLKMKSEPWAMAKAEGCKVVVTFPHEELVRVIEFNASMAVANTNVINVGGPCYGVAYTDETLILSYNFVFMSKTARVQILNMDGKVLKSIEQDSNGEYLFSDPHHLALSPDNAILYVSDLKKDIVTSLTLNGKVKAVYKDCKFKGPCQVVVDSSGTVFVCGNRSANVYQLTSDLKMVKMLLDFTKDIGCPTGLAFCQTNNLMYVGLENSSCVKVYGISV